MRKTSVYLTDDEAEGLRRLAVREGPPQAELIREGVRKVIAEIESQPRAFRSPPAGPGDLAEGTFVGECLDRAQLRKARDVVVGHRDLRLRLADASLVVIA